jgi:hypothetical protein
MITLFDPGHRVKCELPACWLQKVISNDELDLPTPTSKQRTPTRYKQEAETSQDLESPVISKRKRQVSKEKMAPAISLSSTSNGHTDTIPYKKRPCKLPVGDMDNVVELSDSEDELHLPPPRLPVKSPASCAISQVVDLGSPSSSEGESANTTDRGGGHMCGV